MALSEIMIFQAPLNDSWYLDYSEKMGLYYSEKLSAEQLKLCYDLAPAPVKRYLDAEIEYVHQKIRPGYRVLELGCGYGRVLQGLSAESQLLVGIDTSLESLIMAKNYLEGFNNIHLIQMDATKMGFKAKTFDLVCCIQNGISAFHVDQRTLLRSAVEVAKLGGKVLFSSYADEFWEDRLEWFRIQASHGLVGEIDESATGNGVIVCKDGFTATTVRPDEFLQLCQGLETRATVRVVANSSVFCEITV